MQDVVVIGGGIAGLASAWHLGHAGLRVRVLEQEAMCATHSSGRNAAIFRHLEPDPALARLALRSRTLLDELVGGPDWLATTGAVYVGREPTDLAPLVQAALEAGLPHRRLEGAALLAYAPSLAGGDARVGVVSDDDGIIDIHRVTSGLQAAVRRQGTEVQTRVCVEGLLVDGGRCRGVVLDDGSELAADHVVVAAGAWAGKLGASVGAELPLTPLRRHLVILDQAPASAAHPVVWRMVDEVYLRPEPGGTLVSPCDEMAWPPSLPPADDDALIATATRVAELAPSLQEAGVRSFWACLRTFAPDRNLVIGPDPRLEGLSWLAGLGGHGMTLGLAAGELLASALVAPSPSPDLTPFLPQRLIAAPPDVELRHAS